MEFERKPCPVRRRSWDPSDHPRDHHGDPFGLRMGDRLQSSADRRSKQRCASLQSGEYFLRRQLRELWPVLFSFIILPMRILLTNDDGIDAPGFKALLEAVRPLGEI